MSENQGESSDSSVGSVTVIEEGARDPVTETANREERQVNLHGKEDRMIRKE